MSSIGLQIRKIAEKTKHSSWLPYVTIELSKHTIFTYLLVFETLPDFPVECAIALQRYGLYWIGMEWMWAYVDIYSLYWRKGNFVHAYDSCSTHSYLRFIMTKSETIQQFSDEYHAINSTESDIEYNDYSNSH